MASIVNATQKKVKAYLKEIYGKNYKTSVQEVDDAMVIHRGSAAITVFVRPLSKEDCLVTAQAYVVQGAKIGPKLLGMLMRLNATNPVGAFGMLFDDTIIFRHSISGANLDLNELRTSIRTVAFFADEYDDDIRKIAGGHRAIDARGLLGDDAPAPSKTRGTTTKPAAAKKSVAKKAKSVAKKAKSVAKKAKSVAKKAVPTPKTAPKKPVAKKPVAKRK